jgi:hypothetical protein
VLKGYSSVLGAQKPIFQSRYALKDFKLLFLGELGTYPQNLISMRLRNLEKNIILYKGYAEIHIERSFLDNNRKDI